MFLTLQKNLQNNPQKKKELFKLIYKRQLRLSQLPLRVIITRCLTTS